MADNTKIEWCDHTVNFWWGCSKVSPGCANCYAEAQAARFLKGPHWGPDASRWPRVTQARNEAKAYNARAEREGRRFRIFTNSMSDFFEDHRLLGHARLEALDVIRQTPHLDWLILTKRPEAIHTLLARASGDALSSRNYELATWIADWGACGVAPANVWLGTTVEDQERADQRIPALLQVPAVVRFLSCEPLLGAVDIRHRMGSLVWTERNHYETTRGLDWVICGGESGSRARPMHPDWARGLRDQCASAGVPFLFKQWGEYLPAKIVGHLGFTSTGEPNGGNYEFADQTIKPHFGDVVPMDSKWVELDPTTRAFRVGKKAAGRLLDGVEHNGFPGGRP